LEPESAIELLRISGEVEKMNFKKEKFILCCENCGHFFTALMHFNEKGVSLFKPPKYCKLCESRGFKNE